YRRTSRTDQSSVPRARSAVVYGARRLNFGTRVSRKFIFFFFKQKTAYEIGLGIPAEPLFRSRSFAASWLLNALLRIFAMSIITPKRKVLRMSVQDCWRPPL